MDITDSPQDGAGPDQDKAQEHITKAESFCQAAEFNEALEEIGKARKICPGLKSINQVEAEIKSTAEKYKAEISAVREALSKKEFSEASSACKRASELCPQAEVTKSLEHRIELDQAVQSGYRKPERSFGERCKKLSIRSSFMIWCSCVKQAWNQLSERQYLTKLKKQKKRKRRIIAATICISLVGVIIGIIMFWVMWNDQQHLKTSNDYLSKGNFDEASAKKQYAASSKNLAKTKRPFVQGTEAKKNPPKLSTQAIGVSDQVQSLVNNRKNTSKDLKGVQLYMWYYESNEEEVRQCYNKLIAMGMREGFVKKMTVPPGQGNMAKAGLYYAHPEISKGHNAAKCLTKMATDGYFDSWPVMRFYMSGTDRIKSWFVHPPTDAVRIILP